MDGRMRLQKKIKQDHPILDIELYKTLFNAVDEAYCVIQMYIEPGEPLDYRFIEVNQVFEQQSNLVNAKGKWMRELSPQHEEYWFEIYRNVALTGQPVRFENKGEQLQGRWYSLYAFRVGKPGEHLLAILFNDITYRKKAEQYDEQLLESEERLGLALEAVNLGTWELNLETGLVFHNLRHDQIFGYQELQPKWTLEDKLNHVVPEDRQMVREAFEQAAERGGLTVETRIRWKDGSLHWIYLKGLFHYDSDRNPVKIVGIISDFTQRKEAELALQESETRLKELNETKDKFFSIIAHDLKSPFNSILGFSELLLDKIQDKEYGQIEAFASIIEKSALRAMNLLNNLYIWTKLQTGRMEFNPQEKDIIQPIHEAVDLLFQTAAQKSIDIQLYMPVSFPIMMDQDMISTVLRNLLSNAIKFTNPQGQITLSALPRENELEISVCDNGVGIKEDKIESLFVTKQNGNSLGTSGEEGSGLGLMLCHEFVTRHGGRIWAESAPGRGSNFIFTIPLKILKS